MTMSRIRTILAASDFSAPAHHAVARAARLARDAEAGLALLHVVSQGTLSELRKLLGTRPGPVKQRVVDRMRTELERLATEIGRSHGIPVDPHLATGTAPKEIASHADAIDADLLVLGAHGEHLMRHMALGSTPERLLGRTRRPILVVKHPPGGAYRRVLVAVDLSRWSIAALELARAIAPRADLVMLHAFEVPFEGKLRYAGVRVDTISRYRAAAKRDALRSMKALAAQAGLEPQTVRFSVRHGDASRHILDQEKERDCDLLVLGKHGRDRIEELLVGSVTKHALAESRCDVLVSTRASIGGRATM